MSEKIEGRAEELLRATNFCNVSTLRADGSVHSAPVWVDVQDGTARPEHGTRAARGRTTWSATRRVTLTVQNLENPYEYVEIRGRASSSLDRWRRRTHRRARKEVPGRR